MRQHPRPLAPWAHLQSKYSVHSAYNWGMTFLNRERIALLESKFHFQFEYCNVPAVALFQIRNFFKMLFIKEYNKNYYAIDKQLQ